VGPAIRESKKLTNGIYKNVLTFIFWLAILEDESQTTTNNTTKGVENMKERQKLEKEHEKNVQRDISRYGLVVHIMSLSNLDKLYREHGAESFKRLAELQQAQGKDGHIGDKEINQVRSEMEG
jgi:hypothetical protein